MARIRTIDASESEGKLKEIYDLFNGDMANILKLQSLNPSSLEAHLNYYRVIMFGESPVSRKLREMIATVVSSENECFY